MGATVPEHPVDVCRWERSHGEQLWGPGERTVEAERQRAAVTAQGEHDAHGQVDEAPHGEGQHRGARPIEPLGVVDGEDHGPFTGRAAKEPQRRA